MDGWDTLVSQNFLIYFAISETHSTSIRNYISFIYYDYELYEGKMFHSSQSLENILLSLTVLK